MINRKCWITVLCLGLMTFLAGNLWAASPERQQWSEVQAKMAAEGWKQISDGVFERQMGATKVEHLGYGKEGLAWTIGELSRQHDFLVKEYESYPSEDLAKVIDELSIKIANAKHEFRNMPKGMSSMTAALAGASCSNICYSATADAYYLPVEVQRYRGGDRQLVHQVRLRGELFLPANLDCHRCLQQQRRCHSRCLRGLRAHRRRL